MSEQKIKEAIERALIKADMAYGNALDLWMEDSSLPVKELTYEARARLNVLIELYAELYTPDDDRTAVLNLLRLWRGERKLAEEIGKAEVES